VTDDASSAAHPPSKPLIRWVSPVIGTGGVGFGVGSASIAPQRPFGMARPGPDGASAGGGAPTFTHCSGYSFDDVTIVGFSQTRMHGTGIADYGTVGLMPTIGMTDAKTTQKGYRAPFKHANETVSAGYYAVTLDDSSIKAEMTATDHVAYHRYAFPKGSDAVVILDVGHTLADTTIVDGSVTIDAAASEISGFSHFKGGYSGRFGGMPVYYVARFARPFAKSGVWKAGVRAEGETTRAGADTGAWVSFDTTADASVEIAVGLSFVDLDHARKNLDAEAKGVTFDAARKATEDAWEKLLSRVEIEVRNDRDAKTFYTALYHTLLMPTLASDVDGTYRGLDAKVHTADGFRYYTDFSLWDTFRTEHPLLVLAYPEFQRDFLRSLVAMGKDGGVMPKWPLGIGYTGGMVGESADVVFADSYAKGLRDFDLRAAYDVMKKSATTPVSNDGRGGVNDYLSLGYVPIESGGASTASTLEYAYDDFALAILADALGEKADKDAFSARAKSYQKVWDAETQFFLGRHKDGRFERDIDFTAWHPVYAEGDSWQYLWYVPHDPEGLAALMGGREKFFTRLDEFFALSSCQVKSHLAPKPYYWQSNEVDLFAPWLYSALDRPSKTAEWIRWILATEYGEGPDGLPGNDDAGEMSAWYVFAAAGFYPIAGTETYLVGSPILPKTTFHLPSGDFVVRAKDTSALTRYVTSAQLGTTALDRARFPHSAITKPGGVTLDLTMAKEPSSWGQTFAEK